MRWAAAVIAACVALGAPAGMALGAPAGMALGAPAGMALAGPEVDLSSVVLSRIDGYQPAPAGARPAGALTDEELAQFVPDPARRQALKASTATTYARSFVGGGQRRAMVVGIDFDTVPRARSFLGGAREHAVDVGDIFPAGVIAHGFRVALRPGRAPGTSTQQVFMQSGPLAFIVAVSDVAATPVTDAQVVQIARAQAAAVPKDVAAQEDASEVRDIAREAGYAAGFLLPIALVVGGVLYVRRR